MQIQFITEPDTTPKIVHHKNSRKHKRKPELTDEEYLETKIGWSLLIGVSVVPEPEDDRMLMEVQYEPAVKQLTETLRADLLLLKLNSTNIFDFEYQPNEGDYFVVRHQYVHEMIKNRRRPYCDFYMGFIFREGRWVTDFYRVRTIAKEVKVGTVETQFIASNEQ